MNYSYSSIKVLDNVSFSIEENAINSIIGPSGSGKSTIVKILTGLLKTDAEIDISFMKMDKKNLYEIRKKIGVVFENPDNQFVADTVIDDIAFSLENMNYKNDIIMKKIKHIAKLLDMEYLLYREPAKLSGGEKELVAIAGALAHDPKVLILDEALKTSNTVEKGSDKAYDLIVKCNTALNKNKVPKAERFAVINSEVLEELQLDARFTKEYRIMENGIIEGANINGTQLVFSEELNEGGYAIVVLHKSAVGYAKQLEETEAMRLQNSFADGIRGLQVDGVKTLREEAIVKCVQA